jgi:uroporphyrinogen III methyltransferase / synthase
MWARNHRHVSGGDGVTARPGVVYLVGAGPGDPGLMTARSLELIASADTIFYDRLIPAGALDAARPDADLVYVGKAPTGDVPGVSYLCGRENTGTSESQGGINAALVEAARAGKSVVRLKGGDPFVFGRGGEEGEALREAGVELEVVPGVTAGVAATAYAGIPVTHRDDASAVAFVTGHEDPAKDETALDWEALARFPGTLVFYMGVRRLRENAAALVAAGRDPDEPAAAVERGTMAGQRTVVATLGRLADAVEREGIGAPALIVVGPVVLRRQTLAWLERRPLHGRRVVVTRARAQASGLASTLRELGAEAVELPAIRIEPRLGSEQVRRAVERIGDGEYSLVCLTSPNGVRLLFEALDAAGLDARALGGPRSAKGRRAGGGGQSAVGEASAQAPDAGVSAPAPRRTMVAAIGPGTARALAEHGIAADVVPERFLAEALVEALAPVAVEGRRVLVARAAEARDALPDALRERDAEVDVVALYETVREEPDAGAVEAAQGADYVTFTSSSTVRNLTEALGERFPGDARVVSIGPITSEAARAAGLEVAVEAERHDVDGLVAALLRDAAA